MNCVADARQADMNNVYNKQFSYTPNYLTMNVHNRN